MRIKLLALALAALSLVVAGCASTRGGGPRTAPVYGPQ